MTALQNEYSLWTRGPETNGILDACEELRIGFVPYSPLGKGFLTRAMNEKTKLDSSDFRSTLRFTPEAMKANQALIDLLGTIAQRKQATPGPDCARVVARAEAVDCSDSRHDEVASIGGKSRRG